MTAPAETREAQARRVAHETLAGDCLGVKPYRAHHLDRCNAVTAALLAAYVERDAARAEVESLREAWVDGEMQRDRDALLVERDRLRDALADIGRQYGGTNVQALVDAALAVAPTPAAPPAKEKP